MRSWALLPLALALACGPGDEPPATPIDTPRLLAEMVDLDHLTRFPDPAYRLLLASSTDRQTRDPNQKAGWFRNHDLGNYQASEERNGRREFVLLETEGPGALVRIWSANPAGTLRIYLDGAAEPTLEADMADLLGGRVSLFRPPFAYVSARGSNFYFPIAFARGCKVTMDSDGAFYQVHYRSYPAGTPVESFSPSALPNLVPQMRRVAGALEHPARLVEAFPAQTFERRIALAGPGTLRELEVTPSRVDAEALRTAVLVVSVDGSETVRVPVGDFFGTGPGLNPFTSLVAEVRADGALVSRWPMPFFESLEIAIEGLPEVAFPGRVRLQSGAPRTDALGFHAAWRERPPGPSGPPFDWNLISIQGRGLYTGTKFEVSNSTKAWWGEGDEKIWVDGERSPSHFGTGTEDYFGYAWATPSVFARPYHGQSRADGPGGYGRFSMHRWHILDPIPFEQALRFDLEVWHWEPDATLALAAVAYFYAEPGVSTNALEPTAGSAGNYPPPPLPQKAVAHAIEGELMRAQTTHGSAAPESTLRYLGGFWSQDRQLRWRDPAPDDVLQLGFDVPVTGRYRLAADFTRGRDYGRFAVRLETARATTLTLDLGHPIVSNLDGVDLGTYVLEAGPYTLRITSLGASRVGEGRGRDFGIDLLLVEPLD
jgi:hypothetical protein